MPGGLFVLSSRSDTIRGQTATRGAILWSSPHFHPARSTFLESLGLQQDLLFCNRCPTQLQVDRGFRRKRAEELIEESDHGSFASQTHECSHSDAGTVWLTRSAPDEENHGCAVAGVLASISLFFNVLSAAALGVHSLWVRDCGSQVWCPDIITTAPAAKQLPYER